MPLILTENTDPNALSVPAPSGDLAPQARAMLDLYKRLHRKGLVVARDKVGLEWADEVVQQSFVDLWEVCFKDGGMPHQPVDALFFRILHTNCADHLKGSEKYDPYDTGDHDAARGDELHSRHDPARVAEAGMLSARIDYLIETFPEQQRKVLMAARQHDWSVRRIVSATGMNDEQVKWHLKRGRERLRRQLEKDGYPVPDRLRIGRHAGSATEAS